MTAGAVSIPAVDRLFATPIRTAKDSRGLPRHLNLDESTACRPGGGLVNGLSRDTPRHRSTPNWRWRRCRPRALIPHQETPDTGRPAVMGSVRLAARYKGRLHAYLISIVSIPFRRVHSTFQVRLAEK